MARNKFCGGRVGLRCTVVMSGCLNDFKLEVGVKAGDNDDYGKAAVCYCFGRYIVMASRS